MLLDDIGNSKFSLLIDESTDISTQPLLFIVLVPCICHSLHKAAEYAFKTLPSHLKVLIKDVYGYFCMSSSRKDRYATLYKTINGAMPKKLIKVHDVRWLSLLQCTNCILEQWNELVSFFEAERAQVQHNLSMQSYLQAYLLFCRSFLKPFVEKNVLFQTEKGDILKLITESDLFYVRLLKRFVSNTALDNHRRSNAELMEFDFERHIR
uniref:Transposase n=1 Tax=Romanomermis culicivorax TaxID=13658 RepID=A0A915HKA4_ROMCU